MLRCVALVRTDVAEECISYIIRVKDLVELVTLIIIIAVETSNLT
jgi:hypothetical protein